MSKRQLVLVEWVDSHGGNGWQWADDLEGHAEPMRCCSVGWQIARANGMTVLAASLSGDDNPNLRTGARGDIAIPDRCITRRQVLRVGKAPREGRVKP